MQRSLKKNFHIIALFFIAALSFALNFYAISNNGTGNEYYAACIKSMTQSFHNFFFVSFDPSGMVSVDKPPLGLWTQAISVLIFGYHGWAMLLPQALAGTASCLMIYALTAKYFGRLAGLVSSLVFALTPAVVVASRNNTMDMQLIFVLLAATWFLFRSIETGKWRYLFWAAAFVGLGFNIKMLQAYMILPAIALTYLFFAKEKVAKRILAGVISIVIMLGISFAWVVAVDLTPAANRPYVDSTSGNSMMELILGHNGTERLFGSGMGGGGFGGATQADNGRIREDGARPDDSGAQANEVPPNGGTQNDAQTSATIQTDGTSGSDSGTPPQMPGNSDGSSAGQQTDDHRFDGQGGNRNGFSGGGMGGSEIGTASAVRLWTSNLYGQSSWLLLFAILSIFACFQKAAMRKKEMNQVSLVYWALWLAAMVGFFSFAGFYHRYYLCMLAPAIAVLSGVGIAAMYRGFRHKKESKKAYIRPVFLLVALLANLALEIRTVLNYDSVKPWLLPIIAGFGDVGILFLILHMLKHKRLFLVVSTAALVISTLTAPFYWALTPVLYVPNATMPYAGPELAGTDGMGSFSGGQRDGGQAGTSSLEQYLVSNYKEGSFLVVSQRSSDVAQYIIDTGLPCYAYGGFLGSDNSLTLDQLKSYVSQGKITYFLVSSQNGGGGSESSELINYVKQNATLIDSGEYSSEGSNGGQFGGQGGTLYLFE